MSENILEIAPGPATWSHHALDTFVAPGVSGFVEATIPDRSAILQNSNSWLSRFVLQSMLQAKFEEPYRQLIYVFVRRSRAACRYYEFARRSTLDFLQAHTPYRPAVSQYAMAIDSWEIFLAYAWQAVGAFTHFKESPIKVFARGDDSELERLNVLHTYSKHAEEKISTGKVPENSTFAVWMTTPGLTNGQCVLTWNECASILDDLAKAVEAISSHIENKAKGASA